MLKKNEIQKNQKMNAEKGKNSEEDKFILAAQNESETGSCLLNFSEREILNYLNKLQETLEREMSKKEEEEKEKLEEAKTKSMMTKYQMLFVKIEIYLVNLAKVIKRKTLKHKLIAFLEIKNHSKNIRKRKEIAARRFIYQGTRLFGFLELLFRKNKEVSLFKGFAGIETPFDKNQSIGVDESDNESKLNRSKSESKVTLRKSGEKNLVDSSLVNLAKNSTIIEMDDNSCYRLSRLLKSESSVM